MDAITASSTAEIAERLATHGVCIVPSVLDERECESMVSGAWHFLEHATAKTAAPISRADQASWRDAIAQLAPLHGALIQRFGIGRAQFSWDVRQNRKVASIFGNIWGVAPEDLIVSFDGAAIGLPPEITNRGWHRNDWFHVDQSPLNDERACIQGWVTGCDVRAGDATLVVLRGSHNHFEILNSVYGIVEKSDWYKLELHQLERFKALGCEELAIECPAGSLVLWDSRTVHQGRAAMRGRAQTNMRVVSYVCYMPRSSATAAVLKKRVAAFENGRTTSHWPNKCKLFGKGSRYGKDPEGIEEPEPPVLSEFGKRLI